MTTETLDKKENDSEPLDPETLEAEKIAQIFNVPVQEIIEQCHSLMETGAPKVSASEEAIQKLIVLGGLKLALAELSEQKFSHQFEEAEVERIRQQWHQITSNPTIKHLCHADDQPGELEVDQIAKALEEAKPKD